MSGVSEGAGDAPAPKASGWLSAKRELRSNRKGLRAASEEARVCRRRRRYVRSQRYEPRHGRLSKSYCLRRGSANPSDETERTASRTEARLWVQTPRRQGGGCIERPNYGILHKSLQRGRTVNKVAAYHTSGA